MGKTNLNITTGHHTRHLYSVQYKSTLFPLLNLPIWYLMTLFIRFSEIPTLVIGDFLVSLSMVESTGMEFVEI